MTSEGPDDELGDWRLGTVCGGEARVTLTLWCSSACGRRSPHTVPVLAPPACPVSPPAVAGLVALEVRAPGEQFCDCRGAWVAELCLAHK